jgi:peptidyl-prolyl cis-trans isomerase SurA
MNLKNPIVLNASAPNYMNHQKDTVKTPATGTLPNLRMAVRLAVCIAACSMATAAVAQANMPPPPTSYTPNATVVEDVVARINDQIITRSDIARSEQELEGEMKSENASADEVAVREKDLLRDQIDQQLLLSKGKEDDISCDTDVLKQLDEIRKQNHLDSMDDLQKAVESQGLNYEDFKASIRNSCISQKVVQQEVGSRIPLTHAEVLKYYNDHKGDMSQPESVRLSEILIPTPEDADAAAIDTAQAKTNMVMSNLKSGGKFAELAALYSGGPTAQQGGDLGVFKRGQLATEFETAAFALDAGGYTQPIRTRQGFVIFEVTEHVKPGIPEYKDVEPQMEQAVYMEKMQPAMRAYLTQLREEAFIDIAPGFVDTGASANETKPVNSAYVPPAQKVKKSVTRKSYARVGKSNTSKARVVPAVANGKQKKIKREKVRFGQAPRENLPSQKAGGDLAQNVPAEVGANNPNAQPLDSGPSVLPAVNAAPVDQNTDPLAPKVAVRKKSRYTDRARLPKQPKQTLADNSSIPSKPTEAEIEAQKVQTAPLGLNSNTAAKPKAKKHMNFRNPNKKRFAQKSKTKKAPVNNSTPITAPVEPMKN